VRSELGTREQGHQRGDLPAAAAAQRLQATADAHDTARTGLGQDLRALALVSLGGTEVWAGRFEDANRHLAVYPVCTKFSGDSPVEYQEEEIWYSDDAGEPGEPGPAKPEPFDLAAVNGKLAALDGR
jgi:hypothetical protein